MLASSRFRPQARERQRDAPIVRFIPNRPRKPSPAMRRIAKKIAKVGKPWLYMASPTRFELVLSP